MATETAHKSKELHDVIIEITAGYFGNDSQKFKINTRHFINHEMSYRKSVCYYLLRSYTFISHDQIAIIFDTGYSTIRNGCSKIENLLTYNRRTMDDIREIKILIDTFNEKMRKAARLSLQ